MCLVTTSHSRSLFPEDIKIYRNLYCHRGQHTGINKYYPAVIQQSLLKIGLFKTILTSPNNLNIVAHF